MDQWQAYQELFKRIGEQPTKMVFNVNVGHIPPDQVAKYIQAIKDAYISDDDVWVSEPTEDD